MVVETLSVVCRRARTACLSRSTMRSGSRQRVMVRHLVWHCYLICGAMCLCIRLVEVEVGGHVCSQVSTYTSLVVQAVAAAVC